MVGWFLCDCLTRLLFLCLLVLTRYCGPFASFWVCGFLDFLGFGLDVVVICFGLPGFVVCVICIIHCWRSARVFSCVWMGCVL